jgi:general secretion pathway protein L
VRGYKLIIQVDLNAVTGALYGADASVVNAGATVGFESEAGLGSAVKELLNLIEAGAKESGRSFESGKESLYLSLAPALLSFRVLTLPFTDKIKILDVLPIEMNGMLGIGVDDVQLDAVLLGEGRVLAVAVEKAYLRRILQAVKESGVDPVWIGSALFAAPKLVGERSGCSLLIGPGFIATVDAAGPTFYNSIARNGNCSASIKYLEAEGVRYDRVLAVGIDADELRRVVGGDVEVEELGVENVDGLSGADSALLSALAQQIDAETLSGNVNFRAGEFSYSKGRQRIRSKLKLTAVLVSVLLSLVGADLYLRYARYSGLVSSIQKSTALSYRELFPETRKGSVTDALYLLEAKMKAIESEGEAVSGISPLTVMRVLTEAATTGQGTGQGQQGGASGGIRIQSATVTPDRISVKGTAATFEAANRYKEAVAATGIGDVRMADVKSRVGAGVTFSLVILR